MHSYSLASLYVPVCVYRMVASVGEGDSNFARHQRMTAAELMQRKTRLCQEIWQRQVCTLQNLKRKPERKEETRGKQKGHKKTDIKEEKNETEQKRAGKTGKTRQRKNGWGETEENRKKDYTTLDGGMAIPTDSLSPAV